MDHTTPKLYDELAEWWQLISPTSDYADEGAFFRTLFADAGARTILELGAGGGNVAWHLKDRFAMTLTDVSPAMLRNSEKQNPQCEHGVGDMRTLRLGRTFDGVLVHDAVMYMLTEADLAAVFRTAAAHLEPGGTFVAAPDCTTETFEDVTIQEGHDADGRAVRYLQWVSDPDPHDTVFDYDLVIGLKDGDGLRAVVDRHTCGLFPRQTWLDLMEAEGFTARVVRDTSTDGEALPRTEVFVGTKRP